MKYFAALFTVLFIWSAYLQLNDPDPVWWVTIYLIIVYIGIQAFMGRYNFEMLTVVSILYFSLAINSWLQMTTWEGFMSEGQGMAMKTPNQELARESAGLMICVCFMLVCIIYIQIKKKIDPIL